jgi:hypothetical protein
MSRLLTICNAPVIHWSLCQSRLGMPWVRHLYPICLDQYLTMLFSEVDSAERRAIQSCTSLRHLSIVSDASHDLLPTHLIDLLSVVSSKDLITIDITITKDAEVVDAENLDQVLARPKFRNLRSFMLFKTGGPENDPDRCSRRTFAPECRWRVLEGFCTV